MTDYSMKILHVNAVYGFGSTGRNVLELHRYLKSRGYASYVAYAIPKKQTILPADQDVFRIGDPIDRKIHAMLSRLTGAQGYWSHGPTKRLLKKIDTIRPDIVHLNNLHSNYVNLPVLLKHLASRKMAVVITLHDCWFFTGGCYHYSGSGCGQWQYGCIDCPRKSKSHRILRDRQALFGSLGKLGVIGVSDWITSEGNKSFLKNAAIIRRIYNWIDPEIFKPLPDNEIRQFREELKIPPNKHVILGVSQGWSPHKGLSDMLKLADYFHEDAVVILVGERPHKVARPDNVIFYGFTHDLHELAKLYNAADVLVNPSRLETFGKVTAEALATGTPVVLYDNTGSTELIDAGCGFAAENLDVADLIEKTSEVLQHGKVFFSAKCVKSSTEKFDMQSRLGDYVTIYNELLGLAVNEGTFKC